MSQQLQRQGRTLDHSPEWSLIANPRRPLLPERGGDIELAAALVAVDRMDVVIVVAQYQPALLAFFDVEVSRSGGLLDHPVEGLGTGQCEYLVGTVSREQTGTQQLESSGPRPVLEARHEGHAHPDAASRAAKSPVYFGVLARG